MVAISCQHGCHIPPGQTVETHCATHACPNKHATWCSGVQYLNLVVEDHCIVVDNCPYDVRFFQEGGICECKRRGWSPEVEAPHEHKPEWIHNDNHLVCPRCDLDVT
jgi:hypothetical protein